MSRLLNRRSATETTTNTASVFSNTNANILKIFEQVKAGKPSTPRKAWTPMRFRLKAGESRSIIILDAMFSYAQKEHTMQIGGRWDTVRCIQDTSSCPVCALPSSRTTSVVLLTVLDLTPYTYTNKEGQEVTRSYSKMELALKGKDTIAAFENILLMKGSLRGVEVTMTRGLNSKDVATGLPSFVSVWSEEDMVDSFGHEARMRKDGTEYAAANSDTQPFDYSVVHGEDPSPEELAAYCRIPYTPLPGSRAESARAEQPRQQRVFDNADTVPWDTGETNSEIDTIDLSAPLPDVD